MARLGRLCHQFCRTAGACLALFVYVNAAGDLFIDRFGADFLWIRFPDAVAVPGRAVLLAAAAALLLAAFRPIRGRLAFTAAECLVAAVACAALWNALGFYALLFSGRISSRFPFPSSLVVVGLLAANAWRIRREHLTGRRLDTGEGAFRLALVHGLSFLAVAVAGPLFLLLAYGATDYAPMVKGPRAHEGQVPSRNGTLRSKEPDHRASGSYRSWAADCIVVYGARVYADGRPSLSLADRVREGVRLWKAGRGRHLVLSGGLSEGRVSEPEAMKRLAVAEGVRERDIVLDETGHNTFRSAVGASRLMRERGWRASLSVSHYYHLLRIQLAARRAGLVTYTVPARMTRRLSLEPYFVLREVAAFYGYYFFRWDGSRPGGEVASRSALPDT